MSNNIKRMTKVRLAKMGIKIFQKDIKSVKVIKCENIGHKVGWTKDTIKVEMKDGTVYTYIAEPTGIYSGECKFTLID